MSQKPIGQLLKEKGYITEAHIKFALKEQQATGERLGEVLARIGLVTDFEVAKVLAEQSGYPFLDLRNIKPEPRALMKVPSNLARENEVLPIRLEGLVLHVAVADPYNVKLFDLLARVSHCELKIFVASKSEIKRTIEWYYYFLQKPPEEEINRIIERVKRNPAAEVNIEELLNNLLIYAISLRATDVHLSPSDKTLRVHYRLDGILELYFVFPAHLHQRLIGAIKVRAGMDIAEQRRPQDGRMRFEFLGEEYDFRISTVRATYGENMVIRILPVQATVLHLSSLGFEEREIKQLELLFTKPYGMIIITGPTGSGKTTTLYSALRLIDVISKNVLTAEDPVEYSFPLIRQTQINEEIGYNFATAIRHFLRQDPDVILVGEIRDEETATMAVRAALTGHLFLSTLHTNDAVSAVERLRDLGVKDSLLAGSLLGVTAQRLLRRVCPHCKEEYEPPEELLTRFNLPKRPYSRGKGCPLCRGTGYAGRFAVTEIFYISEEIRDLIAQGAPHTELLKVARREGFVSLLEAARKRVLAGESTVEEMARVIG